MNEKDLASQLERMAQTVKVLEERIARMERNQSVQQPYGPITYPTIPVPSVEWSNHCPKCGLKLDTVMGYVCSQPKCPTGLGGAWCSTT